MEKLQSTFSQKICSYDGKLSRTVLRGKGAVRLLTYPIGLRISVKLNMQ